MIAVDTNILVYAHRIDNEWHDAAAKGIRSLAEARTAWAIPWPCVHEFFGVVTRHNLFNPPSTPDLAMAQIEAWFESPSLYLIGESAKHLDTLKLLVAGAKLRGPTIHDARIAAICIDHGVSELWTADRDFLKFPGLRVRNPLTSLN